MNEFLKELSLNLVSAICVALLGLIGIGIRYLNARATHKPGEQAATTANQYLSILDDVAETEQSMVDRLNKECASPRQMCKPPRKPPLKSRCSLSGRRDPASRII